MKLKTLVRAIEALLGMKDHGDEPRADMYLPDPLMIFGVFLLAVGVGLFMVGIIIFNLWLIAAAVAVAALGAAAVMCWKNQTVRMISDEKFEYTTFLGNTYTYYFSDIEGIRKNSDSLTLFVGGKKVHIESMAVMSSRLSDAIESALDKGSYCSVNSLHHFEFHDALLELYGYDGNRLKLFAEHLNIHKTAPNNEFDTDMEIALAKISLYGFSVSSFTPVGEPRTDEKGNQSFEPSSTPLTGEQAETAFLNEFANGVTVYSFDQNEDGSYCLEGSGSSDWFSVDFFCASAKVEWNDYTGKAWYEDQNRKE